MGPARYPLRHTDDLHHPRYGREKYILTSTVTGRRACTRTESGRGSTRGTHATIIAGGGLRKLLERSRPPERRAKTSQTPQREGLRRGLSRAVRGPQSAKPFLEARARSPLAFRCTRALLTICPDASRAQVDCRAARQPWRHRKRSRWASRALIQRHQAGVA